MAGSCDSVSQHRQGVEKNQAWLAHNRERSKMGPVGGWPRAKAGSTQKGAFPASSEVKEQVQQRGQTCVLKILDVTRYVFPWRGHRRTH